MAIVNAFTTVNPETEATVRAVDYQVVGAAPEQFRVYSDDERDVARRRRVETPESGSATPRRSHQLRNQFHCDAIERLFVVSGSPPPRLRVGSESFVHG